MLQVAERRAAELGRALDERVNDSNRIIGEIRTEMVSQVAMGMLPHNTVVVCYLTFYCFEFRARKDLIILARDHQKSR